MAFPLPSSVMPAFSDVSAQAAGGFRVIAHDLAGLVEALDLKDIAMISHSTGHQRHPQIKSCFDNESAEARREIE